MARNTSYMKYFSCPLANYLLYKNAANKRREARQIMNRGKKAEFAHYTKGFMDSSFDLHGNDGVWKGE